MTLTKLPNGRWRARVHHDGKDLSVAKVLGMSSGTTWRTKRDAREAWEEARVRLKGHGLMNLTVREFWTRWTTDPLFSRAKESTNIHNRERTKGFVERYGELRLNQVNDLTVAAWLQGGHRNGTVPALRAMFNDAMSAKAGRLIERNPFAGLGLRRTSGNRDMQPPTEAEVQRLIKCAKEATPPSFAAYFEFACLTGARPGELDALQWERVRFEDGEVDLVEQWNAKTRSFTAPKYGSYTVALVGRARALLLDMPREDKDSPYVFITTRGTHYTPSSRSHHWNRVRCFAGFPGLDFYLATRHHFGWYALNILGLEPHIIAEQLGHRDGGRLVISLYGHPDKARARRRIREAFDQQAKVVPLHAVERTTG
jgi:integrase